uniref:lysozyme n=1 Tax=Glossina morsitans morsitans TaxID=37546 RepID=A0A240SWY4_GLOMM
MFQISDQRWCSYKRNELRGCNLHCSRLIDDNIADDVECIKHIYKKHDALFGDGFTAWAVYLPYCRNQQNESVTQIAQCFDTNELKKNTTKTKSLKVNNITHKTYKYCELTHELYRKHHIPLEQIPIWICIVQHESDFNTAAVARVNGSTNHGIFQISDLYWCSHDRNGGKACNISCDDLLDSDISDDVRCVKTIYEEHTGISGDGFTAWVAYKPHCRNKTLEDINQCFGENEVPGALNISTPKSDIAVQTNLTTKSDTKGKIYSKCELAQELYRKHHIPMEQIPIWVCIVQHESGFNTSAIARLNADGSADHGLFHISDLYWCSHDRNGGKACNISCDDLLDSDISDDVRCVKTIYEEHTGISGDGFTAWVAYKPHCRNKNLEDINQCLNENEVTGALNISTPTSEIAMQTNLDTKSDTKGKIYSKCELAQELYRKHHIPMETIPIWVCIAQHESGFNTSAIARLNADGSADHGLFQISDLYWCSHDRNGGKACNISCNDLLDSDISDDLRCVKTIYEEHTGISGDGFTAWVAYKPHCRNKNLEDINQCLNENEVTGALNISTPTSEIAMQTNLDTKSDTKGKIYSKCELAQELYRKHHIPMEQIPIWVCIVQHESGFNTSAIARLNADGSADHGLFQISDLYWCSHDRNGGKACNISCHDLLDSDISDDLRCEHTGISGDGFTAWVAYKPHCRNKNLEDINQCLNENEVTGALNISTPTSEIAMQTNLDTKSDTKGKIYSKCELAQELYRKHHIPMEQIPIWVCIVQHESGFNTSAIARLNADGSADHGLFQISDLYWCSHDRNGGKACNISCNDLLDSDISDDLRCVKTIYEEHTGISGDGFTAWVAYKPHCRNKNLEDINQCLNENEVTGALNISTPTSEIAMQTNLDTKSDTKGKIYSKCELAQELYRKHHIPMEQIPIWVCIAQHESGFNTSAIARLNADGSADHGLFQISDLYWCSHDRNGGKACNISCDDLLDSDISDDVRCVKAIYEEHSRISGDGFTAWSVYKPHCLNRSLRETWSCFPHQNVDEIKIEINLSIKGTRIPELYKQVRTSQNVSNIASIGEADCPLTTVAVATFIVFNNVEQIEPTKISLSDRNGIVPPFWPNLNEVAQWVCIAQETSGLNSSLRSLDSHGLFQINERFWCSPSGSGCNVECDKLRDDHITDDLACVKIIHAEHQRISGDGYTAWPVYQRSCRNQSFFYIKNCFGNQLTGQYQGYTTKNYSSKVYDRCELARELYEEHNIPIEQVATWICIAQHESHFNTSAVGRREGNGSIAYGLFQISNLRWCSYKQYGLNRLIDDNIADDVECIKRIYKEHAALFGDGFTAWKAYLPYCRNQHYEHIASCFEEEESNDISYKRSVSSLHLQYIDNPFFKQKKTLVPANDVFQMKEKDVILQTKVYAQCSLAQELYFKHNIPIHDVAKWICIAQHASHFDTSKIGPIGDDNSKSYGLFQINDRYWCSRYSYDGKGCNVPCVNLLDSDISDDIRCIKLIQKEHERISGDGFDAWTHYKSHCQNENVTQIAKCFDTDELKKGITKNNSLKSNNITKKVYKYCELAQELYHKHHMPMEQIPTWVCIAQHESSFNTAAIGRLNADGSADHGLFQISDLYWCSHDRYGNKACGISCDNLLDSDISDDIRCVRTIYEEHTRISGNGFTAWTVYQPHCRNKRVEDVNQCFNESELREALNIAPSTNKNSIKTNFDTKSSKKGKIYNKCELAQELYHKHHMPMEQIPTWVCIAQHESSFNTAAIGRLNADGSADHGLFQISDLYWCSHDRYGNKACGISCDNLLDSDISDDIRCVRTIYEEHTRISGNGFTAWTVYQPHCRNKRVEDVNQCFNESELREALNIAPSTNKNSIKTNFDTKSSKKGKIYNKCELAQELYHKHHMPMEQIPTWVCIAQHESSFNTAAIGRLNADGSADHGLFQISDLYWCSHDRYGNKACGISCDNLLDSDISDDIRCVRTIYEEHTRISGNGFTAWTVYQPHCRNKRVEDVNQCFNESELREALNIAPSTNKNSIKTNFDTKSSKKGKIYNKCELAQELYHKHHMPMEQIPTWVCIAQHESSFNTAAIGRLNADGSADHGLFQISDLYWCSHDRKGAKKKNENNTRIVSEIYFPFYTITYHISEAPVILTLPHMLGASNEYTSTVRGLKPDAKKHQTYVDVQQVKEQTEKKFLLTGTPLQGGKRVQFNMFLKTINRITITENLTTVLMPAIWIDEVKSNCICLFKICIIFFIICLLNIIEYFQFVGIQLNDEMVHFLKQKLINSLRLLDIFYWMALTGGIITGMIGFIYYAKNHVNFGNLHEIFSEKKILIFFINFDQNSIKKCSKNYCENFCEKRHLRGWCICEIREKKKTYIYMYIYVDEKYQSEKKIVKKETLLLHGNNLIKQRSRKNAAHQKKIVYAATSKAAVIPAFQDFADVDIEKELSSSIVKKPTSNSFGQTVSNNNHRETNSYLWYNHPTPQDKCISKDTVEHAANIKVESSDILSEKKQGEKQFQNDKLRVSDELENTDYARNFKSKYLEENRCVLKGGYSFQINNSSNSNRNAMNSSQPAQAAPGNRITFTSQTLPNGTINIGSGHPGAGSTIISTSQLPNTTTIKTITAGAGQPHHGLPQQVQVQHHQVLQTAGGPGTQPGGQQQQQQSVGATQTQTLVIKSNHAVTLPAGLVSSAPGIVTMTKTIQQQGNQPILNSMIPASVVVGMRPPNAQQQPKNVQGNNLGRVVIGGPHMVGTRPQSPAITLSALTQGPTPALILKTENGFQLLRVGTATSGPVTQTIATNSTNPPQIRLQTVPSAVSRFTGPPLALRKTIVRSSTSSTSTTKTTHHHHQQQQQQPQQQQHQQQATTTIKQIKQNRKTKFISKFNILYQPPEEGILNI